ncbi:MAG: hypothetical protein ACI86H_000291 [bacterium]|jgi:hypothetical protein
MKRFQIIFCFLYFSLSWTISAQEANYAHLGKSLQTGKSLIGQGEYQQAKQATTNSLQKLRSFIQKKMPLEERLKMVLKDEKFLLKNLQRSPEKKLVLKQQKKNQTQIGISIQQTQQRAKQLRKLPLKPKSKKNLEAKQYFKTLKEVDSLLKQSYLEENQVLKSINKQKKKQASKHVLNSSVFVEKALKKLLQQKKQRKKNQKEQQGKNNKKKQQQKQGKNNKKSQQEQKKKPPQQTPEQKAAQKELAKLKERARQRMARREQLYGKKSKTSVPVRIEKDW